MRTFWGLRKDSLQGLKPQESPEYKKMQAQFAELCAYGAGSKHEACYTRGLETFDELCGLGGIQKGGIGINIDKMQLLLGTEMIYLKKEGVEEREIGEFIITISKNPVFFSCVNITRPLVLQQQLGTEAYLFHHPHVNAAGEMCTGNKLEIHQYIAAGELVGVARIILASLRTIDSRPYASLEHWPIRERN